MGLSSFLAASTDAAQYAVEMAREKTEIEECPLEEEQEIYDIFAEYGIERCHVFMVVERLKQDPEMWVKVSSKIPRKCVCCVIVTKILLASSS
jgi:hypothetical protein